MMLADAANLHTFVDAFRFIGDNPAFLAHEGAASSSSSPARRSGSPPPSPCPLGIVLGHSHRGSGVAIGASIVGRALPSLVLIAAFLTILGIGFVNNMVALAVLGTGPILTNAYDGDRRRRPRHRRGGARHGHDRACRSSRASSCRSRFPCSSPEFASPPSRSSQLRRSRRSPAAAGSATSSSTRRATGSPGVLGASFCVMALSAVVFLALAGAADRRNAQGPSAY